MATIEAVSLFATHLVSPDVYEVLYNRYSQKVVQQASDSCQLAEGQSRLVQKITRFSKNVHHIPPFIVAQDNTAALPATSSVIQRHSAH